MDLHVPHGDSRKFSFALTQKDAAGVAQVLNLTGKAVRFAARREYGDGTIVVTKLLTVTDAPTGKCDLDFVPGDTSGLTMDRQVLVWDVQVEDGTNRYRALDGRLEISPEVTIV